MKGYKTMFFGFILAGLGFLQAFDWATVVPQAWVGIVMALIGGAVMWLRAMTDTAVGKPE